MGAQPKWRIAFVNDRSSVPSPKGMNMHIEPGSSKSQDLLSYVTGFGASGLYALRAAWQLVEGAGFMPCGAQPGDDRAGALMFFEVLPHRPVGVSEVHLIPRTTLFLLFVHGAGSDRVGRRPAAARVVLRTLDPPQYGMNIRHAAGAAIQAAILSPTGSSPRTPLRSVAVPATLALSDHLSGGVVTWAGFWALYGQGFTGQTVQSIAAFGAALHDGDHRRTVGRPRGPGRHQERPSAPVQD